MIKDFHPFDIMLVKLQEKQQATAKYIDDFAYINLTGPSNTYIEGGEFKACIGMELAWKGRAQCWAHIGTIKNWVSFTRSVRALINENCKKHNIVRLELITEDGFEESERFAKLIGFKKESVMRRYGVDGRDNTMWVKIWD